MRNYLILNLIVLLTESMQAQDSLKFNIVGGNAAYFSNVPFDYSTDDRLLLTGAFVGHKFKGASFLGLNTEFNFKWSKYQNDAVRTRILSMAISPIYRLYRAMNKSYFFFHLQIDIGHSGHLREVMSSHEKDKSASTFLGAALGCGADIYLFKNLYLEPLYRLRLQEGDMGSRSIYTNIVLGLLAKF